MKQVRFIPINTCGLRIREADGEGQQSRIVDGMPIVFGVRSVNLTPWSNYREVYEVLEPGCISQELIQRSDVIQNINHSNKVTDILGRHRGKDSDTLELKLTPAGVVSSCNFPKTNCADDTLELIKRGDISGMSFAFEDDWEDTENGVSMERMKDEDHDGKEVWVRHVKRITGLYDVSIVTHPAYEQTSVASREQGDEIMKAIDAQIEAQTKGNDTESEKQREQEEQAKREAEEAEKQKAEAEAKAKEEERERQEREMMMERQRRRSTRRHMAERLIENL